MDIQKKLEEIRNKPELIKIRYVWGAVAISMFFIVIIWIFSFQGKAPENKPKESSINDLKESLKKTNEEFTKEIPSLEELMKNISQENQSEIGKDIQNNSQNQNQESANPVNNN